MKNNLSVIFTVLIVSVFLNTLSAMADSGERRTGLGVILGEPTGISFKQWQSATTAFDAAAAWSFGKKGALHLHADYLIHNFHAFKIEKNAVPFYYGIGGRIKFEDESKFGVRFPIGLTVFVVELPLDMFLEVVPVLNLAPKTEADINAALGIRYYFR